MMTNLFSTFDPSISLMNSSWCIIFFIPFMASHSIWKSKSNTNFLFSSFINTFKKELSYVLTSKNESSQKMVISIICLILPLNFIALYPQIFSVTAHLTITLPFSLTMWMTVMLFGWTKKTSHMLSHLVPQGTPIALMNFMVLIELTSNFIRPITLCVRLTANMIAGHLLMSLLGNSLMSLSTSFVLISIMAPLILTVLEGAVACIQAYVFMTLISLYVSELEYDSKI